MGTRLAKVALFVGLAAAICVPIVAAAASPLLAYRGPVYIIAGFAGISRWRSFSFSHC